jgi:hypothetical protein
MNLYVNAITVRTYHFQVSTMNSLPLQLGLNKLVE